MKTQKRSSGQKSRSANKNSSGNKSSSANKNSSGNKSFSANKNFSAKKRSTGGKSKSSRFTESKLEEARSTFGRPSTSKQSSSKSTGKFGDKKFGDKKFSDKKFSDKKFGSKSGTGKFSSTTPSDRKSGDKKFSDRKLSDKKFGDKKFGDRKFADKKASAKPEEKRIRIFQEKDYSTGKRKSAEQRSSGSWSREFQPKDSRSGLGGKNQGFVPYRDFTDKIKFDRRIFDDEPDEFENYEYEEDDVIEAEDETVPQNKLTRLNKFISNAGVTARRKADELIFTGRVTVNMKTVTEPGTRVNPEKDVIKVDGEKIKPQSEYIYVVLFKPRGYVTTTSDDKGRPTVMDLIGLNTRLYPIGRLDYDTDGVLLLTNDGEFSNTMMHPRHKVFKTYFAKLDKPIEDHDLRKLKEGVLIDGKPTSRAKIRIIPNTGDQNIWISIHEGRNRQVRRMLEALGYMVQRLKRVEYARIGLDDLKPGDWRYMTPEEVDAARKLATPKPVQVRKNPEPVEEGAVPQKVTGKKGGKKKKKLKKLEKMQQKLSVKQQKQQTSDTGSDVMDSISKELEDIKEQIADTHDVKSE